MADNRDLLLWRKLYILLIQLQLSVKPFSLCHRIHLTFHITQLHYLHTSFLSRLYHPSWLHIAQLSTIPTLPLLLVRLEDIYRLFNLRPQIRAVETLLIHHFPAVLTIPSQRIHTVSRSRLLQYNANRIGKTNGIVRRIGRKEKHLTFTDGDVAVRWRGVFVDDFEEHGAAVLVEPFCGGVDVVVCSGIRTADNHDRHIFVVDTVIVDWGLEEVGILFEPGPTLTTTSTYRRWPISYHLGKFNGLASILEFLDRNVAG